MSRRKRRIGTIDRMVTREDIIPMATAHAGSVARLHRDNIRTGFLSSLGPAFLNHTQGCV